MDEFAGLHPVSGAPPACARRWAATLRAAGIHEPDADGLAQQAWVKVVRARMGRTGTVAHPKAYFCRAVASVALRALTAERRTESLDAPGGLPLPVEDRGFARVDRHAVFKQAVLFLEQERPYVWRRAVARLGEPAGRAEELWSAGVDAARHVLVGDGRQTVKEIIGEALGRHPYWNLANIVDDDPRRARESLRKRVNRVRCWVSYVVLEAVTVVSECGTAADPLVRAVLSTHCSDVLLRETSVRSLRARLRAYHDQLTVELSA